MYSEYKKEATMKKAFNPDDFFTVLTIKDIIPQFEQLKTVDFKKVSLNDELIKLNHEIVSKDYKDFMFSNIEQYSHFEIDRIV